MAFGRGRGKPQRKIRRGMWAGRSRSRSRARGGGPTGTSAVAGGPSREWKDPPRLRAGGLPSRRRRATDAGGTSRRWAPRGGGGGRSDAAAMGEAAVVAGSPPRRLRSVAGGRRGAVRRVRGDLGRGSAETPRLRFRRAKGTRGLLRACLVARGKPVATVTADRDPAPVHGRPRRGPGGLWGRPQRNWVGRGGGVRSFDCDPNVAAAGRMGCVAKASKRPRTLSRQEGTNAWHLGTTFLQAVRHGLLPHLFIVRRPYRSATTACCILQHTFLHQLSWFILCFVLLATCWFCSPYLPLPAFTLPRQKPAHQLATVSSPLPPSRSLDIGRTTSRESEILVLSNNAGEQRESSRHRSEVI